MTSVRADRPRTEDEHHVRAGMRSSPGAPVPLHHVGWPRAATSSSRPPRSHRQVAEEAGGHLGDRPAHLILLVEDSTSEAVLTVADLRDSGLVHRSLVVPTVADARAALRAHDIACVLLDLGLPDAEGLSAIDDLLAHADVPIVVLTGRDDTELAVESVGRGAQDYLVKGRTDPEVLARTVRYAIERHRVEHQAMAGYELAQSVLDAMESHTAVLDASGTIVSTNAAWVRFGAANGGDQASCGIGASYVDVCRSAGYLDVASAIESVLAGGQPAYRLEYDCHSPAEERWFEMRVVPVRVSGGPGAVVTHSMITELKEVQERLTELAGRDPLTGLANRGVVLDAIARAVGEVRTYGCLAAVAFVDLDRFKTVNDSLGHAVGDILIRQAADRLVHAARAGDVVSRFGGDEFVVVCGRLRSPQDATAMAERFRRELSRPYVCDGHTVTVGASVGLSFAHHGTEEPQGLLDDADIAMYEAKARGRGRVHHFELDLRIEARARFEQASRLRAGIDAGELVVHYQPLVDTATEQVCGAEALVRWCRDGVLVSPDDFVELAERSDLIGDLDRFVLDRACRDAARWTAEQGFDGTIAVNLSALDLLDGGLPVRVATALAASGLPAERLVVEVTETALIAEPAQAAEVLAAVRALGVLVAVDDFGTGYSSLAHLKHLPVDELKIDRTFVAGLGADPLDTAVVEAVIRLGAALDVRVVAEGVEAEDQHQHLRALGCTYAQGFHWSPAVDEATFARLLAAGPMSSP